MNSSYADMFGGRVILTFLYSISSVPDQNTGQNSKGALQVSKVGEFGLREETLRVKAQSWSQ